MENDPGKKVKDEVSFFLFLGTVLIFMGLSLPVRSSEDTFFGLKVYSQGSEYFQIILVFLISFIPLIISLLRSKIKEPNTLFSISLIVPILSIILITPLMMEQRYDNRHYQMAYGMYVIILGILIQFIFILYAILKVPSPTSKDPQKKNQSAFILALLNTAFAFSLALYYFELWIYLGYLMISITAILLIGTALLGFGKNKVGAVFCLIGGILTIPVGIIGVYAAQKAWNRSTKGNMWVSLAVFMVILAVLLGNILLPMVEDVTEPEKELRILHVGEAGSGWEYTRIQDAINDSLEGETVFVHSGGYDGDIDIERSVNLIGEDRNTTFIYIPEKNQGISIFRTSNTMVANFTLIGPGLDDYYGYAGVSLYESQDCIVQNNIISNINDAIKSSGSSNISIVNNNISDTKYGVVIYSNSGHQIENNTIINCSNGIRLSYSTHNNITGNVIYDCEYGIYVNEQWKGYNNISGNVVKDNMYGIFSYVSAYGIYSRNRISNNSGVGLYLSRSGNSQVYSNEITFNEIGIYSLEGGGNKMRSNNVSNNSDTGIKCLDSNGNLLDNNLLFYNGLYALYISSSQRLTMSYNEMLGTNMRMYGSKSVDWDSHNIDDSNTVNGTPVLYWKDKHGGTVPTGVSHVIIADCSDITVEGLVFESSSSGIQVGFSEDITISNNTIRNNRGSIYVIGSNDCLIDSNFISENREAIKVVDSFGNYISNNNVTNNSGSAIYLLNSNNNMITGNNISFNNGGVILSGYLDPPRKSNNNIIYHNNIINNSHQASDTGEGNLWNASYPLGGNYWSDYEGVDLNSTASQDTPPPDGIGDTSYVIVGPYSFYNDNYDHYPLMKMHK